MTDKNITYCWDNLKNVLRNMIMCDGGLTENKFISRVNACYEY